MEQLNLITTSELKKGTVFYFENGIDRMELNWSELNQKYCVWLNESEQDCSVNYSDIKKLSLSIIMDLNLKLTSKPIKKEIDFTQIEKDLAFRERTKITNNLIEKGIATNKTEVGMVIKHNMKTHARAKLIYDEATRIINERKKK